MMNDELLNPKNLGKTLTQWPYAAGIYSATDLRRLGSVGVYRAVRARGFRASEISLYVIEGTFLDVRWNELPPDHKAALLGGLETFPVRDKS